MSFGAGFGGVICTQLAQEIADYKEHGRVRIIDRFHAAIIVIPLYSTVFIFYMLNYIFPHLFKYLKSFMEWKDNHVIYSNVCFCDDEIRFFTKICTNGIKTSAFLSSSDST